MEKYYCDQCCLLYNQKDVCPVCGINVENKIIIEVQSNAYIYKKELE